MRELWHLYNALLVSNLEKFMAIILSNVRLYQQNRSLLCIVSQIKDLCFGHGFSAQLRTHCQLADETSAEKLLSISDINLASEVFMQSSSCPDEEIAPKENVSAAYSVAKFIKDKPEWEDKLLGEFPDVIKPQNRFSSDFTQCNLMFIRLVKANAVHNAKAFLEDTKFDPEPQNLELYIRCLCRNGLIDEALSVIKELRMTNYCLSLRTWNLALSSSVTAGRANVTWTLHSEMTESGAQPNVSTIGHLILAFCQEKNAAKAYDLLRQLMDADQFPNRIVVNKLIWSLCKNGDFGTASAVLHHMIAMNCDPDINAYHPVIHGLCKRGMIHEGFLIFNELKQRGHSPNTFLYTTMIHALCRKKNMGEARKLWFEMISNGTAPNEHTYNALLDGYCKNGHLDEAQKHHNEMVEKGFGKTAVAYNTMITGLCFNGKLEEARLLFEEMNTEGIPRDHITYSLMIKWFAVHGKTVEAVQFLYESLKQEMKPSTSSLIELMTKLCETECIDEAKTLWEVMCDMELKPVCLCLVPIVGELIKRGDFGEAMGWLCYLVRNGFKADKAMEDFVEATAVADDDKFLVCSLVVRSYMLKMGLAIFNAT